MKRIPIAAVVLWLFAGCSGSSTFVYKPAAPVAGGKPLPLKLAVLPFSDGTGNYTVRGSALTPGNCTHNLAKTGIFGRIDALTPELWAKAFADELAASGAWRSVRFVYGPSELADEDFYVEGTLTSADSALLHLRGPNRFALVLRARRKADNGPVWEKDVAREWEIPMTLFDGCGISEQCRTDRAHTDTNRAMQALFANAREDLAKAVGSLLGSGTGREGFLRVSTSGEATEPAPSRPSAPESVEQTIDRLLREK